jgi:hypothetical protein
LTGFLFFGQGVFNLEHDRDIINYKGRTYANLTDVEWFKNEKSKYQKGEKLGETKNGFLSPLLLWNFSATKLPKGTALYHTKGEKEGIRPGVILVERENGEILYYLFLPEE